MRGVGEQGQAAGQDGPDHLDDEDGQRDAQHGGEFAAVVGQGCPVAVAVVAHDAALTLLQWASVQHVALEEEDGGAASAGLAAPRLESFAGGDAGDDQPGDRVGPPPPEEAVNEQAGQEHRGQIRAEQGLFGVGHDRPGAQFPAGSPLRPGQEGYDRQGEGRDPDA